MRVETIGLGHRFDAVVLRDVELVVETGRSLALFGRNGSGKSTLLRCLAGLLRPTVGQVLVDGDPVLELRPATRARIGYVAHRPLVWGGLTAAENLELCGALYRIAVDPAAALERVGLDRSARVLARALSQGQRQRLAIARALLPAPTLLLLDEPHAALDEEGAEMLDTLVHEHAGAVTMVLSTHERERGQALCDAELVL